MIAQTQSKSGSSRQGLFALVIIGCALIAWVIWLGHKQARYDEEERVINAERVEWLQAVNYWTGNAVPPSVILLGDEQILALYGQQSYGWDARIREPTVRECALDAIQRIEQLADE